MVPVTGVPTLAPVPGSSTSRRQPNPSEQDFRSSPASSTAVVQMLLSNDESKDTVKITLKKNDLAGPLSQKILYIRF